MFGSTGRKEVCWGCGINGTWLGGRSVWIWYTSALQGQGHESLSMRLPFWKSEKGKQRSSLLGQSCHGSKSCKLLSFQRVYKSLWLRPVWTAIYDSMHTCDCCNPQRDEVWAHWKMKSHWKQKPANLQEKLEDLKGMRARRLSKDCIQYCRWKTVLSFGLSGGSSIVSSCWVSWLVDWLWQLVKTEHQVKASALQPGPGDTQGSWEIETWMNRDSTVFGTTNSFIWEICLAFSFDLVVYN